MALGHQRRLILVSQKKGNYAELIKEICEEQGIACAGMSDDWFFRLEKDGQVRFIFGYRFGLNDDAVHGLCKDKSATSDVLGQAGVGCVPHTLFGSPTSQNYAGIGGGWSEMLRLLDKHGGLVLGPYAGSGGDSVYRAFSELELEAAAQNVLRGDVALVVSPYLEIENEYRAILLDGKVRLVFDKIRGDDWRHNLAHGAVAKVVDDEDVRAEVCELAVSAAKVIGARFVSVDIVRVDGRLLVLEINSGVSMKHFMDESAEKRKIAKDIYSDAVRLMFA